MKLVMFVVPETCDIGAETTLPPSTVSTVTVDVGDGLATLSRHDFLTRFMESAIAALQDHARFMTR